MSFWKRKPRLLPRSWDDITLGTLVDMQDDTTLLAVSDEPTAMDKLVFILAHATNLPTAVIMELPELDFADLVEALTFIHRLPENVAKISSVRVNGTKYGIENPFERAQLSKYATWERLENEGGLVGKIAENDFAALLRLLSIVCHELGTNYIDSDAAIEDRAQALRQISVVQALGLLDFFLYHYMKSTKDSPNFILNLLTPRPLNARTPSAGDGLQSPTTTPD